MEFRRIEYGSEEYARSLTLRERVLRMPLGLTLTEEDLRDEDRQFHFGLFEDDELAACVVIRPLALPTWAKLRQMAVAEARQGCGLGRYLVRGVEDALRAAGFDFLELSARWSARGFYAALGYAEAGEAYLEQGIPHVRMWRHL